MRLLACLVAALVLPLHADDLVGSMIRGSSAPRKEFASPDGRWAVVVVLAGKAPHRGYLYSLRDRHTGATYLSEAAPLPDEALARDIGAIWSPGSRYVALTIYYGPVVEGVAVIHCRDVPRYAAFSEAGETALLKPQDRARFGGVVRLRHFALAWTGPAELAVGSTMQAFLKGEDGAQKTLTADAVDTIRFHAETGVVVHRERTAYDIGN